MLDQAGAAVFQLNTDGECTYANETLSELSGFSKEKLYEYGLRDAVHPEDRDTARGNWVNFASREPPYESSYRLQRQDGRVVHVIERGSLLFDRQQSITGYLGQVMDVSDQVQAYSALRTEQQRGNRFIQQTAGGFYRLDLSKPISVTLQAEEIVERIHQNATLAVCNNDLAAFYGRPVKELTGTSLADLTGGIGVLENPKKIRQFVENSFEISGEEIVRTDHRGTPIYLSCDVVGMVENNQLVSIWGLQRDISLQKRKQEEMEQREDFLRRVLNSLPGDVFVKDPRCRYLFVSRGFEKQTGIPVEDWMDKTIFQVLPAAARDTNKTSIESMKSGQLCRKIDSRAGATRQEWVETLEQPLVSEDGVIEGVVGISMDVTDQVCRQKELEQQEARFRQLADQNPDGVILADASSRKLTYANPAFCDLFGYTEDEILTLKVDELHSPGSRRQVMADWDELAHKAQHFDAALPCQRKDRSILFAEVGVAEGTFDGTAQIIAVYSSAEGRKKIETELERQRDLHAGLLRSTSILVLTTDCSGIIQSANDALLELLGQEESNLVGKPCVEALILADDRTLLINAFASKEPGVRSDYEVRMTAADGTLFTVSCRVQSWLDPSGASAGFTLSGINVTESRALEQKLGADCDGLRTRLTECEEKLDDTTESLNRSEQQLDALERNRKQLEETLAERVEHFETVLAEHQQRETELNGRVKELESRKTELTETLEVRGSRLEEQSGRCEELDQLLQKTRQEFAEEKKRIESESGQKIKELEKQLKELRTREAELSAVRSRLEEESSRQEKELQARSEELETARSEWQSEAKRLADIQQQLEESLQQSSDREQDLTAKCERLRSELTQAEKALETRSEKLEIRSLDWKTERDRLTGSQQKLEKEVHELTQQLKQIFEERDSLRGDLQASRKEVADGRKSIEAQVRQSTAVLEQELKELLARKNKLETAQVKSAKKLAQLESSLDEKKRELKALIASRKEEGQAFNRMHKELKKQLQVQEATVDKLMRQTESLTAERRKEDAAWEENKRQLVAKTQELEDSLRERTHELTAALAAKRETEEQAGRRCEEFKNKITEEKEKHARILEQTSGDIAEHCREKEHWEDTKKSLEGRIKQQEELASERAGQVEQAVAQRRELETRLEEVEEEADRRLKTVDEQINTKTRELQKELQEQQQHEESLKAEQQTLSDQLAELQSALEERSGQVAALETIRQELEQQVAAEKENLAHRISLFQNEMSGYREAEESWQLREKELMGAIDDVEKQLEKQIHSLKNEAIRRKKTEQDLVRQKKNMEEHHRMVQTFAEDLTTPLLPVIELSDAVLEEGSLPVDAYPQLREIRQCAGRLHSILTYRQELNSIEEGSVHAEPQWFELDGFLKTLSDSFSEKAEAEQRFFTFSREGSLEGDLYADLAKTEVILNTLYDRALQKTQKGPVGLHSVYKSNEESDQISFLLVYSGLDQDAELMAALSGSDDNSNKSVSNMDEDEMRFDLLRRKAQMLGGMLEVENPSGLKPLLRFTLPVERALHSEGEPDAQAAEEPVAVLENTG